MQNIYEKNGRRKIPVPRASGVREPAERRRKISRTNGHCKNAAIGVLISDTRKRRASEVVDGAGK